MVKLKPAKENLKAYYSVDTEQPVYRETDILLAVRYLLDLREQLAMPLVICLGLGTNRDGHDGYTPLEEVLSRPTDLGGLVPVAASGNEGNWAHHYFGILREEEYRDVELRIPQGARGGGVWAGAAADLLYWGIVRGNEPRMDINAVRAYLILGVRRKSVYSYPNREWGYGALDLFGVFETLKMS